MRLTRLSKLNCSIKDRRENEDCGVVISFHEALYRCCEEANDAAKFHTFVSENEFTFSLLSSHSTFKAFNFSFFFAFLLRHTLVWIRNKLSIQLIQLVSFTQKKWKLSEFGKYFTTQWIKNPDCSRHRRTFSRFNELFELFSLLFFPLLEAKRRRANKLKKKSLTQNVKFPRGVP